MGRAKGRPVPEPSPAQLAAAAVHDIWKYDRIHPQNPKQREYMYSLLNNLITVASAPPGCGKTLLPLYLGFELLSKGKIEQIIYTKPDVGMVGQRGRGYLPGSALEKAWPLIGPILDNLVVFMSRQTAIYHLEKKTIEVMLLEDLRGRSLNNCMAIFDETQNVTPADVKTILTRTGQNCHMAICGDPNQCDTKTELRQSNGLADAMNRLKGLSQVGLIQFSREDIVRNGIIPEILDRYE